MSNTDFSAAGNWVSNNQRAMAERPKTIVVKELEIKEPINVIQEIADLRAIIKRIQDVHNKRSVKHLNDAVISLKSGLRCLTQIKD